MHVEAQLGEATPTNGDSTFPRRQAPAHPEIPESLPEDPCSFVFLLRAMFKIVLWCYGIYDRTADAHNEVTLITFYKDLKAVPVPFEDKLPYNKHKCGSEK